MNRISEFKISDEFTSSDHCLVEFIVEIRSEENTINRNLRFKSVHFNNEHKMNEFQETLDNELADVFSTLNEHENTSADQEIIDSLYNSFESKLVKTLENVIGYQKPSKMANFYTFEMKSLKYRAIKLLKLMKRKDLYYNEYHSEYQIIRRELNKLAFSRKKELWNDYIEKINKKPIHEKLKLIRNIQRKKVSKTSGTGPELNSFKEYFSNRINSNEIIEIDNYENNEMMTNQEIKLSKEDIISKMKRMKNSKAPGPSKISIGYIKFGGPVALEFLFKFFNLCLKFNLTPKKWNQALLYPLYKGKGSRDECENFRPIALTEHVRKLFELCFMDIIKSYDLKISSFQMVSR